jgi:hypothetical protein
VAVVAMVEMVVVVDSGRARDLILEELLNFFFGILYNFL